MANRFLNVFAGRLPAMWFNGHAHISGVAPGIVTVNGTAARRWVYCLERISHLIAARTFSKVDGTYKLDRLNPSFRYDVIAQDYLEQYNDVIRARITPVT